MKSPSFSAPKKIFQKMSKFGRNVIDQRRTIPDAYTMTQTTHTTAKGNEMTTYEIETPVEAATRKYRKALKAMHVATRSCDCGARGSWHWSKIVSGTVGDNPAIWQGCERCGAAIGTAQTGDHMYAVTTVGKAADDLGEDIDDWVRHIQMDDVIDSCDRSAALQRRREAARQ